MPTLHRTLDWASCFKSGQVLFRFLHSLFTVRLQVSQGHPFYLPIPSIGFHCIACRATEDSSFRRPNPAQFLSFIDHINLLHIRHFQQIHSRYSIGPINVKIASEATVHKDLKFGGNWFGEVLQKAVHFPSYARVLGQWVVFGDRSLNNVPND